MGKLINKNIFHDILLQIIHLLRVEYELSNAEIRFILNSILWDLEREPMTFEIPKRKRNRRSKK